MAPVAFQVLLLWRSNLELPQITIFLSEHNKGVFLYWKEELQMKLFSQEKCNSFWNKHILWGWNKVPQKILSKNFSP